MSLKPEVGLVINDDFLWKEDQITGVEYGFKDRPCAIILAVEFRNDGSKRIVVCPITHSPPSNLQSAVEISSKLAAHLGLDGDRMWIETDAVYEFTWEKDLIPIGISPVKPGSWSYGMPPDKISEEVIRQVRNHNQAQVLEYVRRDESGSS